MALTDKGYYQLTVSVGKALSPIEMPLKVKHARAAIIGTFHSQGGHSFWAVSIRQPLLDNRIAAWKFCHLLHKVLREGHHLCCQHSMRHRSMLTEMGKLWGHLQDGYGNCIKQYTKFLVTKIEFHERNPRIPSNLAMKRVELEGIGGEDINFYFHMAVEMFDYLDDILQLQEIVFHSLSSFHVNSMTPAGQCRVAPLIPCVQDSSPLYDCLVRIMFKLHSHLPNELLTGHRERFRNVFRQLRSFYEQARSLQYFVGLITVPKIPENAPNFSSQVDFGEYQAPVVVMPEEDVDHQQIVDNLVDVNASSVQITEDRIVVQEVHVQQQHKQPDVDFERLIRERDDLILHLQTEIERHQKVLRSTTIETRDQQARLQEQMASMNAQLNHVSQELAEMRVAKEDLEIKLQAAPTLEQKAHEGEERVKASEEKYQKIKTVYTQIRDEHVKLLRQHGEVSKQLAAVTKQVGDAEREKEEFKCALDELQSSQAKAEDRLQQQESGINSRITELEMQCKELQERAEQTEASKVAEVERLGAEKRAVEQELNEEKQRLQSEREELQKQVESLKVEQEEQLATLRATYDHTEDAAKQALDEVTTNKMELEKKLNEFEDELRTFQAKYEELVIESGVSVGELKKQITEYDTKVSELNQALEERVNGHEEDRTKWATEKERREAEMEQMKTDLVEHREAHEHYKQQVQDKDQQLEQLTAKCTELEVNYKQEMEAQQKVAQDKITELEVAMWELGIKNETALRSLLECCIKTTEKMAMRDSDNEEFSLATTSGSPIQFTMIIDELTESMAELMGAHQQYVADKECTEVFARKVITCGHLLAIAYAQGLAVCNTCADIEAGEKIAEELNKWYKGIEALFKALLSDKDTAAVATKVNQLREELRSIAQLMGEMTSKLNGTENVADLFESELAGMEKSIEEAASKIELLLQDSRASDSGLKLEVNEKILDACTNLMKAIRVLVQKSRVLQGEIVSVGRGTNTAKEFYKRNHQWTEGLISAAKSVAQGANFLVTAANKAVCGEAKHQLDLVVAAQEIAASTAQLVVASRVKAPRNSTNLAALTTASKGVTESTGAVVATAKDCSRQLEDGQDLDLDKLTVHQAKTMEMEIQVKVLELEQALLVERMRLSSFRKKNYQEK